MELRKVNNFSENKNIEDTIKNLNKIKKNKNIHKDHRQRVKQRFLGEGLDHFDEVHALELLLFYALPQGDVNPLATGCLTILEISIRCWKRRRSS